MPFYRPKSVLAGFHADAPEHSLPELTHVGEEWIPTDFNIADHVHPVWEFYFQIEGKTRWEVNARPVALDSGSLLAVAPGIRHRLLSPTPAAHHFFFAGIDVPAVLAPAKTAAALWAKSPACFVRHVPEIAPAFRLLIREVSMNAAFRKEALRLALHFLVLELTRCLRTTPKPASLTLRHPAVVRARELIDHQPARDWTVQTLAVMAGLSPSRLSACFKAEVGMTVHRYLMRARIEAARTMLRDTDLPVTAIALELGYASSQHFSSAFKAATGRSPSASRRKQKRQVFIARVAATTGRGDGRKLRR